MNKNQVRKAGFQSVFALVVLGFTGNAFGQACQDLRDVGDVLTFAIPLGGVALTTAKWDGEGAWQMFQTYAYTGAVTQTFKTIGQKSRPDAGTSTQSFVSGHSSGAFMGAAYIYTRYGKGWGVPAYALAILTAYSRVCAQKHFADDVMGGALVAMFSNWYATSPHSDLNRMYPSFTSNGLEVSFAGFFDGNRQPRDIDNFDPRYSFTFEWGPVTQKTNIVRAPNEGGTTIDLDALEADDHMTARMHFNRYFDDRHGLHIWYGPMGMADFGDPTEPFRVGDTVFDPSDPDAEIFDSNYRWWDVRATYRYNLVNNERWIARVGVGVGYAITEFEVEQRDADNNIIKNGQADYDAFGALLHASAEFFFNDRWSITGEFDGTVGSDNDYQNGAVYLNWYASPLWRWSVGGRYIAGTVDEPELYNDVEITDYSFQLTRMF